ncbi:MAG: hypothetical protein RLZ33_2616 [Bacteroidota bacterium]|jgi:hypothetical protein
MKTAHLLKKQKRNDNNQFNPTSLKEFLKCYTSVDVKAFRIFYPILFLLFIAEPQLWWKIGVMVIMIEYSMKFATPIADWVLEKAKMYQY